MSPKNAASPKRRTIIAGLGNPILGDDGVGWRVAQQVAALVSDTEGVQVECFALGGLSLMEHLAGYQRAIIIDSIFTGEKPVGSVSVFTLDRLPDRSAGHTTAAHDTSLRNALKIGRTMDVTLPEEKDIAVVAVEAESVYDFTEDLSAPVLGAVPLAVTAVIKLLETKGE